MSLGYILEGGRFIRPPVEREVGAGERSARALRRTRRTATWIVNYDDLEEYARGKISCDEAIFSYALNHSNDPFVRQVVSFVLQQTMDAVHQKDVIFAQAFDVAPFADLVRFCQEDDPKFLRLYRAKSGLMVTHPWDEVRVRMPKPLFAAVDLSRDSTDQVAHFRHCLHGEGNVSALLTMAFARIPMADFHQVTEWSPEETNAFAHLCDILTERHDFGAVAISSMEAYIDAVQLLQKSGLLSLAVGLPDTLRTVGMTARRSSVVTFARASEHDVGDFNDSRVTGKEFVASKIVDAFYQLTFCRTGEEARDRSSLKFVTQSKQSLKV